MNKYKDSRGVQLQLEGHERDSFINLVKEVAREATNMVMRGDDPETIKQFLTVNFGLQDELETTA